MAETSLAKVGIRMKVPTSSTPQRAAHEAQPPPPQPPAVEHEVRTSRGCFARAVLVIVATLAAAVLPAVLWPGEISWINDEPRLFAKAYYANAGGTLADQGLRGNMGITYGPVATQIYQAMLLVTHDPITLARLRAGLCAGVTALGMLWLARSLRLNPWFAAAVVLAPYLWVFQRILWDASFAIPIGTIAVAAYASYLRHGGRAALLLALACTLTLPFIHVQDLPLAAPLLGHLLWRHRDSFVPRDKGAWVTAALVAAVMGGVLALNATYLMHLSSEISYYLTFGLPPSYPGGHSLASTLLGPLGFDDVVGRVSSAIGLTTSLAGAGRHLLGGHGYMGAGDGGLGPFVKWGKQGLYVFFPLLWIGVGATVWGLAGGLRKGRLDGRAESSSSIIVADRANGAEDATKRVEDIARTRVTIARIALVAVLLQMLIAGVTRVPAEPQYFFGTFVVHAVLAWIGVEALSARFRGLGLAAALVYGLAGASVTFGTMWQYYRPAPWVSPDPASAMPALGDSVAVAEALARYPADVPVVTDIDFYHRFPQTIRALRLLIPPADGTDPSVRQANPLLIRYRPDGDAPGPRVEVVETASAADVPPDARAIDLTPIPGRWE